MTLFIISVATVLIVSALCSLSEAAIYAVRGPYVRNLSESGSAAGQVLSKFKENMELPISAILILNTIANTAGASIAGAQAQELFSPTAVIWFSVFFTLGVLFVSEIIPKVVGVVYNRPVARMMAIPIDAVAKLLYPVVWVIQHLSNLLKPKEPVMAAPEDEVQQMAMISAEEGSIMEFEADLVQNVLHLDRITTRDIMTPRPVVMKLPSDLTLREVAEKENEWTYSRIPIYDKDDPETWKGFVLRRDLLAALANDQFEDTVELFCKPIYFTAESTRGHVLLKQFLRRKVHLFGVADEFGDITGVVTLEDVLESLIGEEIVDEVDTIVDMQEVARLRKREKLNADYTEKRKSEGDENETS